MAAIRLLSGIFGGDWPNWGHEDPNQGLSAPFNRSKRQGQVRTSTSYWGALPLTHLLATHHVIVRLVAGDAGAPGCLAAVLEQEAATRRRRHPFPHGPSMSPCARAHGAASVSRFNVLRSRKLEPITAGVV